MAFKASHFLAVLASIACIGIFPALPAAAEEAAPADAAADIISTQTGWINADGKITYRFEDGQTAIGETEIGGVYYLFSYSGTLKTDWQTVNGKRCYYDPATGQAIFGWVDYFGCRYYVTPEQGKLTGIQEIDGMTYEFDEDGVLQETVQTETQPVTEETVTETTSVPILSGEFIQPAETGIPVEPETTAATTQTTTAPPVFAEDIVTFPEAETTAPEPPMTEAPAPETPAPEESTETTRRVWKGESAGKTETVVNLPVPDYKQKDPAWVGAPLGNYTIGQYGCLVTAMSMVHSYSVAPCTPVDMTRMLTFTSDGSLKRWDDISDLGYVVETYDARVTPEILSKLYRLLHEDKPVVLGSVGGWQHYVVVTGYTGDGVYLDAADFVIHDPGYSRGTLADHLAAFPKLYKLIYLP